MTHTNRRAPVKWMQQWIHLLIVAGLFLSALPKLFPQSAQAASGDWTTYLNNSARSGFNAAETIITPSTAPHLKLKWTQVAPGGPIFSQPAVTNGIAYWGSLDGYEHATNIKTNAMVWTTYLGKTTGPCNGGTNGVASSATIATINIGGKPTSVDFVGGGDANFYALNAATGVILWHTSLGSSSSYFIWSSPAFYKGKIYIGVASFGDCPLVQGQMVQMDASTGAILHVLNMVPNGCTGGGVWGSPTIDKSSGMLYFATGNGDACQNEPLTEAIVQVRVSDLSLVDSWQVPLQEQLFDTDFGSTPTLFTATINGTLTKMVGVPNKNGIFYAFNRTLIHAGPVWRATLARGGACPRCGDGSISPAAWDGTTLYVAGENTTIAGMSCQGSLRAVDPATGRFIWEHCMLAGPVLGAVTAVPGVVVVGEGTFVIVVDAGTNQTLFRYNDTNSGSIFYGPATISNGMLYIGNMDGNLYAFGL